MTRPAGPGSVGAGRFVVPLSHLRSDDLPRAGGKAANLGELIHAGFPVPDGVCVTTDAFALFLDDVPGLQALLDEVRGLDPGEVAAARDVGARIRAALAHTRMPRQVATEVRSALLRMDPNEAFAVRSSATAEDLPDASFAGQQDTHLDVRGEAALLDAIRRCWASLFTDRAIVYRARNGFDARSVRLAVAVQRMVHADVSGVMFTVDPVSQHRHTLVIDAAAGLGEALVGGEVTPDAYRVDRRDLRILERTIAEPDGPAARPILDDARIVELARMGCEVEAHVGAPQDLEWALADGRLHLLQSRPITSLYPIDALRSPDGSLRVYFSVGHQQSMTRAMPPLGLSTILTLLPGGREPYGDRRTALRVAGGRLYADLTPLLRSRFARRGLFAMLSQLNAQAPQAVVTTMRRPEFRSRPRPRFSARVAGRFARMVGRLLSTVLWRDMRGLRAGVEARMDAFEADARRRIAAASPGRDRSEATLAVLRSIFPFLLGIMPIAAAGVAATRILQRRSERWLSQDEREALTLGLPGNVVNEMNVAIDDLAGLARRTPDVARRLSTIAVDAGVDAGAWRHDLATLDGGDRFVAAVEDFLARYGARAPAEIDLSVPRWGEDPRPLLAVVAAVSERTGPTYRERVDRQRVEREAAYRHLIERAGTGPAGPLRVAALRRLYRVVVEVGGMREHHKFLAVRVLAHVKRAIEEIAEQLHERGGLADPDDVWFVDWPRIVRALDGEIGDLRAGIGEARARHARDQRLSPPMIVTSDGEIPRADRSADDVPDGALVGKSVSTGVVEGVVRVVRDVGRDELQPGEILVAEFTDPGWTPLFMNAAGLVLEVGGALTHGAVVAREYGLPAVVGVRGATSALRTGQRVRVDGVRGVVEVLGDGEAGPA